MGQDYLLKQRKGEGIAKEFAIDDGKRMLEGGGLFGTLPQKFDIVFEGLHRDNRLPFYQCFRQKGFIVRREIKTVRLSNLLYDISQSQRRPERILWSIHPLPLHHTASVQVFEPSGSHRPHRRTLHQKELGNQAYYREKDSGQTRMRYKNVRMRP